MKQQLRRTSHFQAKITLLCVRVTERGCYLFVEGTSCERRKRGQIQAAIHPNATLHTGILVFELKRLKPDHERRNQIPCLGREDRHGYYFVHSVCRLAIRDLPCVGQFWERKLSFCCCFQFSYFGGIGRLDDCAVFVEIAIKSGV